jgi:hypothetical protein
MCIDADNDQQNIMEGELLLKKDWREYGGRYGVGDYVTRDKPLRCHASIC